MLRKDPKEHSKGYFLDVTGAVDMLRQMLPSDRVWAIIVIYPGSLNAQNPFTCFSPPPLSKRVLQVAPGDLAALLASVPRKLNMWWWWERKW